MKTITCFSVDGTTTEVPIDQIAFRPAVYGVLVRDNHVLLCPQWDGYDFPGGGVDIDEDLDTALSREIHEETGLTATRDKLLMVHEDYFTHPGSKKHFHSLSFYFSCKDITGEISDKFFDTYEQQYAKKAQWVPLEKLKDLKYYNSIGFYNNPQGNIDLIQKSIEGKGI